MVLKALGQQDQKGRPLEQLLWCLERLQQDIATIEMDLDARGYKAHTNCLMERVRAAEAPQSGGKSRMKLPKTNRNI